VEEAGRGSLWHITADRGVSTSLGDQSYFTGEVCKASLSAQPETLDSHDGTRLSVGIRVLRGANPAACRRDH
jgi:hypothetical protein